MNDPSKPDGRLTWFSTSQSNSIPELMGSNSAKSLSSQKSPALSSSGLDDLIIPSPSQNVTTFGNDNGKEINYDEIQNLPTPLDVKRFGFNYETSSMRYNSPTSPSERVFGKEGGLVMPKIRNKKKHILTGSNRAGQQLGSENAYNNEKDDMVPDLPKERVNSSISSMMLMRDLKPVDRVVSLPLQPSDFRETAKLKVPLTKIETTEKQNREASLHPLHIVTYSLDKEHRPQKWQVAYEIGSGSFSKVYLERNGVVALKITDVKFSKEGQNSEELKLRIQNSLNREIEILKFLDHPNIIHLIGTDYIDHQNSENIKKLTMALEYCKGGDLFTFILEKREEISCELLQSIFANIVSAILYLHAHNICHRDIKPENILLKYSHLEMIQNGVELAKNGQPLVVLSDFGLSKQIDESNPLLSTRCGSEDYVSPELLLGMPYDGKQNDCWALGVVLYTMLEGRLPFDPLPTEQNKPASRKAKPSHRIVMILWSWYNIKDDPEGIYSEPKSIVKMLLSKKNKRATIQDIANINWVKNAYTL